MSIPKPFRLFMAMLLIFIPAIIKAQNGLTISGRVVDEQKLPLPSATVFLSGTTRITTTDLDGKFNISGLSAGTYIITVKMLGYAPYILNVTIKESMTEMKIALKPNPIALKEVVISAKDVEWREKYDLFKDLFLGRSRNGRNCKITNPKVIRLNYEDDKDVLQGHSDEFLIIENPELGYRVKYLLKFFEYDARIGVTNYQGETNFEDMDGTPAQKARWEQNRLKVYKGSVMHFFRTLYQDKHTGAKEGFLVRRVNGWYNLATLDFNARTRPPVVIDPRAVSFDTLINVVDTSFISLKFKRDLFIRYSANKGVLSMLSIKEGGKLGEVDLDDGSSILQLSTGEALIDSRGKVAGDMPFLTVGKWGRMRIGDMLPYEYKP